MESKGDELASRIKHPNRIKHPALCHIPHARMDTKITIRITKTLPSVKVWKALELALLSPYFAKPNKCNHYQWCNHYHCFNLPFPPTRIRLRPPPALWAQRHVHPPEHLNPSAPGRLDESKNWITDAFFEETVGVFGSQLKQKYAETNWRDFFAHFPGENAINIGKSIHKMGPR